ncbi:MAG: hypothetical protein NT166_23615 [Candidatus Aminicenantes bacterium]|nr:hypothetical protein [Candidatus Aminicenantes bacterium]
MSKLKKRTKVNLWFSEREARADRFFFVPVKKGKKVTRCTGITLDKQPPSDTSVFLAAAYLPIN